MRAKKLSICLKAALAVFTVMLVATTMSAATHEKVLHNFNVDGTDGYGPGAGLMLDAAGNLYGTTAEGGIYNCNGRSCGIVFELTPVAGGGWTEKVLHNFNGTDGNFPMASLIADAVGNLYGTTFMGGTYGYGTVCELTRGASAMGWTEKVLHSFNGTDGAAPYAGLIRDAAGNLYGTTSAGGTHTSIYCTSGCGTVFQLIPTVGGGWTQKVLHNFNGIDEYDPEAGLIFDATGNLYGTTAGVSAHGGGTVFELTPIAGGGWAETVLHNFNGWEGDHPFGGLIFDAAGNLYGMTAYGGTSGDGVVFELMPIAGGGWTEKVLHNFNGTDGGATFAGLVFDVAGNLYGTSGGGDFTCYGHGCGTVFELTRSPNAAGGGWMERVLHSFNGTDGSVPNGLIIDAAGNLFGTTQTGGTGYYCPYGCGTVFEIMR
jgi:uncharacterized repeat protein (TIGR03803 family)